MHARSGSVAAGRHERADRVGARPVEPREDMGADVRSTPHPSVSSRCSGSPMRCGGPCDALSTRWITGRRAHRIRSRTRGRPWRGRPRPDREWGLGDRMRRKYATMLAPAAGTPSRPEDASQSASPRRTFIIRRALPAGYRPHSPFPTTSFAPSRTDRSYRGHGSRDGGRSWSYAVQWSGPKPRRGAARARARPCASTPKRPMPPGSISARTAPRSVR